MGNQDNSNNDRLIIDQESIADQLVNIEKIHINTSQNVLITTEDKLRLHLSDYLNRLEKRKEWVAPFGILLTIIVTLATASFKDFVLKPDTWKALFIIFGIISLVWLVKSIKESFSSPKLDDLLNKLKS